MTAAELKAWRSKLGLTQKEAARVLGIHLNTYGLYEAKREIPKPIELLTIIFARDPKLMAQNAR